MRNEEVNRLKDKLESLSLNSSQVNLVESSVPVNRTGSKEKIRKMRSHSNIRIV